MKKLITLVCLTFTVSFSFAAKPYIPDYNDFTKLAYDNLDDDGKMEKISLKYIKPVSYAHEEANFILKIGNISKKGTLYEGAFDGFTVIDINKRDNYKEIAVHAPGDSDDDEYLIYAYDGKSIKEMGRLNRWPKFYGNGIVLVDNWVEFWAKRDKYVLNGKTRTLNLVPQELYYVGIKAKAKKSFPLYQTIAGKKIVANLKPNSEIFILVCNPSTGKINQNGYADIFGYSYLIKSTTGLVGWVKGQILNGEKVEGLPISD